MTQTIPTDCRDLKAGDRILLVGRVHQIHRVRKLQQGVEILHELTGEPGIMQTNAPNGAKVNFILPL